MDGRNNVVVQITGDGNSVVVGHAHLTLSADHTIRGYSGEIWGALPAGPTATAA